MDAFEVNKAAGAVLSALLVIFASKTVLDIVYKEHKPEKPGWALPITEIVPTSKGPVAPFEASKVVELLPKANPDSGQDSFKKCLACHTPQKGGPNWHGAQSLGRRGTQTGRPRGLPLLGGHEEQGRRVDLGGTGHLSARPQDCHPRQQDGIPRHQG